MTRLWFFAMPVDRQALRRALESRPEVEAWCDAISRAWPDVAVDEVRFAAALTRLMESAPAELIDVPGFFLAQAVAQGGAGAHAAFDGLLKEIGNGLRRQATDDEVTETLQRLRERMLVGEAPRIGLYAARGPLIGFLRITALNLLRNMRGGPAAETDSDEALAALPDAVNVEALLVGADQQAQFREAFRAAVRTVTPRERALLRFNLLDGLSIDELAPMYRVHRSSVARWLADARAALAVRTREQLAAQLRLPPAELESLLASVQKHFDLSLSRALRETA